MTEREKEDPALRHTPVAPYDTIDRLKSENACLRQALKYIVELTSSDEMGVMDRIERIALATLTSRVDPEEGR